MGIVEKHIVRKGESVISLSKRYGIPVDKIWDHPDNSALRQSGRKPAILYEGDELTIPDLETREESCVTEVRHRFRCLVPSVQLKVRFLQQGSPRADEPYVLNVDGELSRGNLNSDGWLQVHVPADTRKAIIRLGEEERNEKYLLKIGRLDPVSEICGVQQRLNNMGYYCGGNDGRLRGDMVRSAVKRFQAAYGLEETGELDEQTKERLSREHGS